MTVKRFVGATARDCLKRVKAEFGPDAIVLSNKQVGNSVEIVAMTPDGLDALSAPQGTLAGGAGGKSGPGKPGDAESIIRPIKDDSSDDYKVTISGSRASPVVKPWVPYEADKPAERAQERPLSTPAPAESPTARLRPLPPKKPIEQDVLTPNQVTASLRSASKEPAPRMAESAQVVDGLRDEMRLIKGLLERQLAGFAWGELARDQPTRALLLGEMIEAGFSGQLSRRLVQDMPDVASLDEGRKWLKAAVNRRLRTLPAEADYVDRGGVYALVGPTGVGKTTTTAKLAARCVVRYGADRLALLTTDGYRIGAQEQLRIYGRILGVPVFVVRDSDDLRRTLADLRDKHMVLIDTVGMSQRDRMVAEQAAMLMRAGEVNRLLLLNAGCRGDTLDDVVRAYAGEDLAGCILTKVDEAAALAPALDCVVRHGLSLCYVANGQRVPEDLHLANRNYLLHRAFKLGFSESAHSLKPEELALSLTPARNDIAEGTSFV